MPPNFEVANCDLKNGPRVQALCAPGVCGTEKGTGRQLRQLRELIGAIRVIGGKYFLN